MTGKKVRNTLPVMVIYEGLIYRPAGFRVPEVGEYYLNTTGKVVKYTGHPDFPMIARTILRPPVLEWEHREWLNEMISQFWAIENRELERQYKERRKKRERANA